MSANATYSPETIAEPRATQPIAVDMPADIDLCSLNQLLNGQPIPVRLRVELPYGTRLLDLHRFANREGLVLTYSDNLIQFNRPTRPGLLQRARDLIFTPQSF